MRAAQFCPRVSCSPWSKSRRSRAISCSRLTTSLLSPAAVSPPQRTSPHGTTTCRTRCRGQAGFAFADRLEPGSALREALRTGYGRMLTAARVQDRDPRPRSGPRLREAAQRPAAHRGRTCGHRPSPHPAVGGPLPPATLPIADELLLPLWVANAASAQSGASYDGTGNQSPAPSSPATCTGATTRCCTTPMRCPGRSRSRPAPASPASSQDGARPPATASRPRPCT